MIGDNKDKSCLSNLLKTFDDILDILDEGAPVDLLYFDFSEAFDTDPHFRLLSKLEGFGVKGKVLDVSKDFLTDRTMGVCVEGQWSEVKYVIFGVPRRVQFLALSYSFYWLMNCLTL